MLDWSQIPKLDKTDYKPLYIQLSDNLAEFIKIKNLGPGTLLPSENDLLAQYDISRTTIRQAIQRLESLEIANKVRGKGTFVAAPKRRSLVGGFQNIEESLAKQGITVATEPLELVSASPPKWAENLRLTAGSQIRLLRRVKLADNIPFAIECRAFPMEVANRLSQKQLETKPVFDLLDAHSDFRISRVIYNISAAMASEQEILVLHVPPETPMIVRLGIYYNHDENAVMAGKVTMLAERVSLGFEFNREDDNWGLITMV